MSKPKKTRAESFTPAIIEAYNAGQPIRSISTVFKVAPDQVRAIIYGAIRDGQCPAFLPGFVPDEEAQTA